MAEPVTPCISKSVGGQNQLLGPVKMQMEARQEAAEVWLTELSGEESSRRNKKGRNRNQKPSSDARNRNRAGRALQAARALEDTSDVMEITRVRSLRLGSESKVKGTSQC
jgi:hypothetical protein